MPENPYGWAVDPVEPLTWLTDRINRRLPACYLRFNDGEAYSMFGLKKAPESNGEHAYTDAVRRGLVSAFFEACDSSAEGYDVLVGSWWYEDPGHPAASRLAQFSELLGLKEGARWSRGHAWHREELEREGRCLRGELLAFVDAVRGYHGPKFIVGNASLAAVARSLGCDLVEVPPSDAARHMAVLFRNLPFGPDDMTLWCAGMPAKRHAWEVFISRGGVVVDAGSLFDGLAGRESRTWLKRNGGAHAEFYYGEFAKAVGVGA